MPALAVAAALAACGPAPGPAVDLMAGDAAAGKALFAAKCASCHALGPGARSGFGPQLNGIVGRPAAAAPGFRYSEALKQSGIVWTDKNLAAFVQSPGGLVPGTSMRFLGLRDGRQVADLLAYLKAVGGAEAAPLSASSPPVRACYDAGGHLSPGPHQSCITKRSVAHVARQLAGFAQARPGQLSRIRHQEQDPTEP